MIRVRDLIKRADGTRILRGVSFEVAPQTVLGISGRQVAADLRLLRCLTGWSTVCAQLQTRRPRRMRVRRPA